jgi:Flp pilus assembly protein TadD
MPRTRSKLATIYDNLGGLEHARERYEQGEPGAPR